MGMTVTGSPTSIADGAPAYSNHERWTAYTAHTAYMYAPRMAVTCHQSSAIGQTHNTSHDGTAPPRTPSPAHAWGGDGVIASGCSTTWRAALQ